MFKKDLLNLWFSHGLSQNQIDEIILKVTGLSKSQLFLEEFIDNSYIKEIKDLFIRFESLEPFEYLVNNACFYGFDFYIDDRVLIPRNDTEVMVFEVLNHIINKSEDFIFIDVWTWSGCIPISIYNSLKLQNLHTKIVDIIAVDLSSLALDVAKINIDNNNYQDKIKLLKSDLLSYFFIKNDDLKVFFKSKRIVITANLPYIKNMDYENMDLWVVNYEPNIALYWWKETGFEMYERLLDECILLKKEYCLQELVIFIEIWFDQGDYAKKFLENKWLNYECFNDNSWIFRCIKINIV